MPQLRGRVNNRILGLKVLNSLMQVLFYDIQFFFKILLQDTSCRSQLSAEVWPGNNLQYFINEVRFDMSDYSM